MTSKTAVLFGRFMRHILRSLDTIITVVITPVAIMLMFVYVVFPAQPNPSIKPKGEGELGVE